MIGLAAHAEAPAVAPLLQQCLDEERAMADWLRDHMSPTLERYLALRSAGGEQAAAH